MKKIVCRSSFVLLLAAMLILHVQCDTKPKTGGIKWPAGQALPHFAALADTLDGVVVAGREYPATEKVMFAALQGLVNKTQPRIYLFDAAGEGKYKWPELLNVSIKEYPADEQWEVVRKYQNEVAGVILYSTEKSDHYKNLATTVGGLKNALPVTQREMDILAEKGIQLKVVEDLTNLEFTTSVEIYNHLYNTYWKDCTHRVFVSLSPRFGANIRDIAMAMGSAVVWLDPRKEDEQAALRPFLADMKAGESIMLGWWAEERSGIGIGTEYGISTIPSDFYENATVWSGMDHIMNLPAVPKKPELENKIYLAIFLSDGDNVQYCQHAMSRLWDNKGRGSVPINWTVSPGLVDIGPGLLNYYYKTATPNDFFASGPSGLGYALIYDAHNAKWFAKDRQTIEPYTKLTQNYLEKSGLRIITIWDEVNDEQMEAYTDNCRYLYGVTVEDWERHEPIKDVIKQDKLAFVPNHPCYTGDINVIFNYWKRKIDKFDGTSPLFLTAQGESWKMGPDNLLALIDMLEELSPGNIVLCRGDHFFNLYNEAHGMPFNLSMSPSTKVMTSPTPTSAEVVTDGSCAKENQWESVADGEKWIRFDFDKPYIISRYVARHAGSNGADSSLNTVDFKVEVTTDGKYWTKISDRKGNTANTTDVDLPPTEAQSLRVTITNPGADGIARIADMEIYGAVKKQEQKK